MNETSARDAILNAVRNARPPAVAAPVARTSHSESGDRSPSLADAFARAARVANAQVIASARRDVAEHLRATAADAPRVLSLMPELPSTAMDSPTVHTLEYLTLFACEATLGVAENGAVWFATSNALHRAALFLAEEVVIVVAAESIVGNLHDAYARIDVRTHSFGAFIAGPSKTADIEQSLVVGAHGPRKLTLIVTSADGAPATAT